MIWQWCTALIFTCEVVWKFSNKIHWKYANLLNLKNCGNLLNSRKLLGENVLFDCKVSDYLRPNWEGCFYCEYDILTQICFMKTLKAFSFVSVQNENKYWTLRSSVKYEMSAFFVFSFILSIFFRACFHQDVHVTWNSSPLRELKRRIMQYLSLI